MFEFTFFSAHQEYAKRVIDHAEKGGRTTLVLRKAAKEGAGGGLGPQFPGKGKHHVFSRMIYALTIVILC